MRGVTIDIPTLCPALSAGRFRLSLSACRENGESGYCTLWPKIRCISRTTSCSIERIAGTPAGIMTLRVMKAERIAKLLDDPVWDEALMIQLPREILEFIIRYILEAGVDKDAFDREMGSVCKN